MSEYKLLVIDDDKMIHRLYTDVAWSAGYIARTARDLESCRIEYEEFRPTLIFLDLKLLEGDGIEVIRYLAEIECKCPIVIISGHDERVRASTLRLGVSRGLKMEGTFSKPIDVKVLSNILEKYKKVHWQISLEELKKAIENREFVLHYQPKINMKSKKIVGAEALVRWQQPDKELKYPDSFIPFLEHSGSITHLTRHVIELAMQDYQKHSMNITVCINLSGRDLIDLHFPDEIAKLADKYEVDPSHICFEITETAVMSQPKVALDILTRLRINGFELSMDDFGTGYSSLVELHRMPFCQLKIDKSFVINLRKDSDSLTIVRSIIDLAKNLNLIVVAEGIETQEAWDILEELNCDLAQGYLISKPVDLPTFLGMIQGNYVFQAKNVSG